MKKTPLKRRTPIKRRAPKPKRPLRAKRVTVDPFETQDQFNKRLLAAAKIKATARKVRKPLRRSKPDPVYEKAVKEWWAGHDHRCEMLHVNGDTTARLHRSHWELLGIDPAVSRCRNHANPRPHHMKKRGKFKSDKSTFLGLCDSCHLFWLHSNEEEARRLGYLTDRPAKTTH